ncbi:MAG: hypothetical protein E4H20_09915, partial [Spirochaetales bacterium]
MFDPGNIVTIVIAIIILVTYRILDRDNRSLEKVKRYADKLTEDMASYADRRADDLKTYAVELDVHQKAAKEVLRRVQLAEDALGSRAEAIGTMASRIAEYDKALVELKDMSGRVDENLRIIHDESAFVDGVARTLRSSKDEVERIKASIPGIREGMDADAQAVMDELKSSFVQEVRSALDDAQNAVEALRLKAEDSAGTVGTMHAAAADAAEERYRTIETRLADAFKKAREEGEKLEESSFRKLQDHIELRGAKLSEAIETKFTLLRDQAREKVAETQGMIKSFKSDWRTESDQVLAQAKEIATSAAEAMAARVAEAETLVVKAETLYEDRFTKIESKATETARAYQVKVKEALKAYQEDIGSRQMELKAAVKETLVDTKLEAERASAELSEALAVFKSHADDALGSQSERLAAMAGSLALAEKQSAEATSALNEKFTNRSADLERHVMDDFKIRSDELRGLVENGLERLEGMRLDTDRLEKALRDSMAGVERRVGEDFALFGKDLATRQKAFETEFMGESTRVKASVLDLESDLNALKSRAYANVSEKLKVFEDEFFADLRKRREDADEKFAVWRTEMDERLAASQRDASAAQAGLYKEWTDASRETLAMTQSRIQEQAAKLAEQVQAHRQAISGRMGEADDALASLKAAVKADLEDARGAANAYLNAELERWKHDTQERVRGAERAASTDTAALEKAVAVSRATYEKAEKAIQSDATSWKNAFEAALKAAEQERIIAVQTLTEA